MEGKWRSKETRVLYCYVVEGINIMERSEIERKK